MVGFVIVSVVCAAFDALYVMHSMRCNRKKAGVGALILFSLVCISAGAFIILLR